jgi:hypothetical protein
MGFWAGIVPACETIPAQIRGRGTDGVPYLCQVEELDELLLDEFELELLDEFELELPA